MAILYKERSDRSRCTFGEMCNSYGTKTLPTEASGRVSRMRFGGSPHPCPKTVADRCSVSSSSQRHMTSARGSATPRWKSNPHCNNYASIHSRSSRTNDINYNYVESPRNLWRKNTSSTTPIPSRVAFSPRKRIATFPPKPKSVPHPGYCSTEGSPFTAYGGPTRLSARSSNPTPVKTDITPASTALAHAPSPTRLRKKVFANSPHEGSSPIDTPKQLPSSPSMASPNMKNSMTRLGISKVTNSTTTSSPSAASSDIQGVKDRAELNILTQKTDAIENERNLRELTTPAKPTKPIKDHVFVKLNHFLCKSHLAAIFKAMRDNEYIQMSTEDILTRYIHDDDGVGPRVLGSITIVYARFCNTGNITQFSNDLRQIVVDEDTRQQRKRDQIPEENVVKHRVDH